MQELLQKKLVSQSEFDKAQAGVKAANAGLEQAQEQLEYTVVRAPYSGIVVKRHVEPGESVNPGKPLMTGLSLESLRAVANVPQPHIEAVRRLQRARVLLPEDRGSVEGKKLTISPFADTASHTFKVRVDLPEGRHGVYPGMFVKAAFVTGEEQRLTVPAAAVVHRSEVTAVYVLKGDAISFRHIRIGRSLEGNRIQVLSGLDAGEEVALEPIRAGVVLKGKRAGKEQ
jgi:RND family efflux transporter MFP subunit